MFLRYSVYKKQMNGCLYFLLLKKICLGDIVQQHVEIFIYCK